MPNSTKSAKVSKPRPDFPLFPHATGRWAKKIRQKLHYFGKTADDPEGEKALNRWLDEKDELLAGRTPRNGVGVTVEEICNQFLAHKDELLKSGEIARRTFSDYQSTGKRIAKAFGHKTPITAIVADDFRNLRAGIAAVWGPVRLGNEIQRVRGVFKYAYDSGMIAQPVRFGPDFTRPSSKVMRLARAGRGLRMFEREELLAILAVAPVPIKAMVLLGANAGMGNTDCAHLPTAAVDLPRGWINYHRPKTGIDRKIPLWRETIAALKAAQAERLEPKDPANARLFFINPSARAYTGDCIGRAIRLLLETAKIESGNGKAKPVNRKGLTFYALRHTFQTIAEGARDLAAVQSIMGHSPNSRDMSATYRERVDDERLKAVTEYVRTWLFGAESQGDKK